MSNLLFQTIDQISREKGIDPQIVIHAIEDAIVVASRKYFKSNEELRGRINPDTGEIDVYAIRKVVDSVTNPGSRNLSGRSPLRSSRTHNSKKKSRFKKPTVGLGRIAAQMAKQVIFQKVREAERESVYAEYHKHVGEVVNCVVKRFENGDIIVELGKTEGKLRQARAVEARELFGRRSYSRDHHQGREDVERSAGHRVAYGSRHWSSICSKLKFRRFTTEPCRSRASRAKPVNGRRSPFLRAKRMSTRWAPASE